MCYLHPDDLLKLGRQRMEERQREAEHDRLVRRVTQGTRQVKRTEPLRARLASTLLALAMRLQPSG